MCTHTHTQLVQQMEPMAQPTLKTVKLFRDFWLYCVIMGFSETKTGESAPALPWAVGPSLFLLFFWSSVRMSTFPPLHTSPPFLPSPPPQGCSLSVGTRT